MYEVAPVLAVVMVVRSEFSESKNPEKSVIERRRADASSSLGGHMGVSGVANVDGTRVAVLFLLSKGQHSGLEVVGECVVSVRGSMGTVLAAVLKLFVVWVESLPLSWGILRGRGPVPVRSRGGANRRVPVDHPRVGYGE